MKLPELLPFEVITEQQYLTNLERRLQRQELAVHTVGRMAMKVLGRNDAPTDYIRGDVYFTAIRTWDDTIVSIEAVASTGKKMPALGVNENNFIITPNERREIGYFLAAPDEAFDAQLRQLTKESPYSSLH